MLQRGAARVASVDVAYGQIAQSMRDDPRVTVIERLNAREMMPSDLPFAADFAAIDVSFISLAKVLPAVFACLEPDGELLAMVKPQFELGRQRVGRASSRSGRPPRGDPRRRRGRPLPRLAVLGFAPSGCRDRRATSRPSSGARARAGASRISPRGSGSSRYEDGGSDHPLASAGAHRGGRGRHRRRWGERAADRRHARELGKHGDLAERIGEAPPGPEGVDLCLVMGGDGSILHALRRFARTGVPVFGVNFGTVGFLAAVEREEAEQGIRRAFAGEIETIDLPGLEIEIDGIPRVGLNDIGFSRRPEDRVAELSSRSPARRSGTCAATGWSPRPRSARPATTSPTRARSWPGA